MEVEKTVSQSEKRKTEEANLFEDGITKKICLSTNQLISDSSNDKLTSDSEQISDISHSTHEKLIVLDKSVVAVKSNDDASGNILETFAKVVPEPEYENIPISTSVENLNLSESKVLQDQEYKNFPTSTSVDSSNLETPLNKSASETSQIDIPYSQDKKKQKKTIDSLRKECIQMEEITKSECLSSTENSKIAETINAIKVVIDPKTTMLTASTNNRKIDVKSYKDDVNNFHDNINSIEKRKEHDSTLTDANGTLTKLSSELGAPNLLTLQEKVTKAAIEGNSDPILSICGTVPEKNMKESLEEFTPMSNVETGQDILKTSFEKLDEVTKDTLLISENAQSPSFIASKESSELGACDDKPLKIPTLSESLKEAVSANLPDSIRLTSSDIIDDIKKNEPSPIELDTPNESLIDTPCESGETTPSASTPADSCQVSAAPSPLSKDDFSIALPDNEDESSKETKLVKEDEGDYIDTPLIRSKRKKGIRKSKKSNCSTKHKGPLLLDEDTRMSANGNDKPSLVEFPPDEDSQSSVSTSLNSSKKKVRSFRCEVIVPESTEVFTASKVVEYIWPMDGNGEHYFIQEHVAQYLGITSFKRKYRDLKRRQIESTEKEYLKDMGLVTEMACDLGLTAVRSEDMLDILFNDFPAKYEELQKILRERKEKQLKEKGKVDYQVANLDKSKMQEYSRKAALNACKWNAAFVREQREERRYSFDLQTFTLHYPMRANKVTPETPRIGPYPIAVLPGQYTDYCKSYSSHELKLMPLQTVLNGPYTAEEIAAEALGGESDEESAPTSVCTSMDTKEEFISVEPEPIIPPVSIDPLSAEKQPRCKACNGGRDRNKNGKPEPLVICGTCRIASHPTCIDLPLTMIDKIEMYSWQCMECKTCAQCNDPDDEEKMIFCDMCDRGYHIYCVGLRRVPNGRWHCKECAICFSCGAKTPSGNEHIKNAEWQHEFKKDKDKQLKYICTLCVPCDKYWKRRQYCTVCLKVYRSIPDDGMVRCGGCPKYIHKDSCSLLVDNERHCNICYNSRNKTALNHSRIIAAAKKKMASSY